MVVSYDFNCHWDSQKKERISHLLSERVLLIMGEDIFEKIRTISFCERERIKGKLLTRRWLLVCNRLAGLSVARDSFISTYEIVIEKDVLFSILIPGSGQSCFDELIIKLKAIIDK